MERALCFMIIITLFLVDIIIATIAVRMLPFKIILDDGRASYIDKYPPAGTYPPLKPQEQRYIYQR